MTETHPYLSIVAVSRNDDHGGNLLQRMQLFIDSLYDQCNRYHIDTELIIVEWNPPAGKQCLRDALQWPKEREHVTARIITVSPSIHNRFKHAGQMPVFQMIGKNAGIRRARGRFILATNIDILFSDELMRYLSAKPLEEGHHYRVDRTDVASHVLNEHQKMSLFSSCRKNRIRVNKKFGTYEYRTGMDSIRVFLKHHRDHLYRAKVQRDHGYPLTHSNACGDFALMDKRNWMDLRGYPELQMYSFHIDSLLLVTAHYQGIREVDLKPPCEIYHIEHSAGSGWTPGTGEKKLFERLESSSITYLTWNDLLEYSRQLRATGDPEKTSIGRNDPSWGLHLFDLPEQVIQDTP